jgi:hypothetical protein
MHGQKAVMCDDRPQQRIVGMASAIKPGDPLSHQTFDWRAGGGVSREC